MTPPLMHLRVLLPYRVFADVANVTRVVADTAAGAYGLWPRRLDCVASLVPGILAYDTAETGEVFLAIDDGILVKTGPEVLVSVRNAIGGAALGALRAAVEREFAALDEREKSIRSVLVRMEGDFIHRFLELRHG